MRCGFCLVLFLCGVADHFWCIFMTLDKIVYDKLYVATCSLLSPPSRSFPRAILASFHPTLKRERKYHHQKLCQVRRGGLSSVDHRILFAYFLEAGGPWILWCNKFISHGGWKRKTFIFTLFRRRFVVWEAGRNMKAFWCLPIQPRYEETTAQTDKMWEHWQKWADWWEYGQSDKWEKQTMSGGKGEMVRLPIRQGKIRPKHPFYRWTFSTVTKNPLYGHSPPSTSTTIILNRQSINPTTRILLLSITKIRHHNHQYHLSVSAENQDCDHNVIYSTITMCWNKNI